MHPATAITLVKLRSRKNGVTINDFALGFRLAARVHDLRQAGFDIKTIKDDSSWGTIARYVLVGEPCK